MTQGPVTGVRITYDPLTVTTTVTDQDGTEIPNVNDLSVKYMDGPNPTVTIGVATYDPNVPGWCKTVYFSVPLLA